MAGNDFGWALAQMRAGKRVRRAGWLTDPPEWIAIHASGRKPIIVNEDHSTCLFRDSDPLLATDWDLA